MKTFILGANALTIDNEQNLVSTNKSVYTYDLFDRLFIAKEDGEYVYEDCTVQANKGDIIVICEERKVGAKTIEAEMFIISNSALTDRHKAIRDAMKERDSKMSEDTCCIKSCTSC